MSVFRHKENIYHFVKPHSLMLQYSFKLIKAVTKSSTLAWNIEGGTLTYNQMKAAVKEYEQPENIINKINNFTI